MKNTVLITLLFCHFFYSYAMHSPANSLPRTHLIPLDEEQNSFIMGSPPRVSRSSHRGLAKELRYLNFDDQTKITKNVFEIKQQITQIQAKINEDVAFVLPLENLPAQASESSQWHLAKEPSKLVLIGNGFGNSDAQSADSIALIFVGKSQGSEELLFVKETIEGDAETRIVRVVIE